MRILLTGAGAAGIVSIIRALRTIDGLYLVGVDAETLAAGKHFVDRFYQVPLAKEARYVPELLRICQQERIDVAIISVDEEIFVLANSKDEFAAIGTKLTISHPENTLLCLDKLKFYYHMKDKFNLPPLIEKHITKPRFGRGSVGISITDNTPECLMQQFVEGQEYTVDVLRSENGQFLATVPRLRIETDSGLSVKGKTVRHEGLISETQAVMNYLNLWGAANIQWIIDENDIPWLIEVNPRLAGGVTLSVAAGANIPAGLVSVFTGQQIAPMTFTEGVTMLRYWEAVFV